MSSNLYMRGLLRLAEKKTQPVKPGRTWVYRLWKNVEYVSSDMGKKMSGCRLRSRQQSQRGKYHEADPERSN